MIKYLLLLLISSNALSAPKVYHLALSVGEIIHNREPLLPNVEHKDWGTAVRWEIGLEYNRVFMDNTIGYEACFEKICTASWAYKLGIAINENFDIYWEHRSQHTLDQMNSFRNPGLYPLFDAAIIRLNFIESSRFRN